MYNQKNFTKTLTMDFDYIQYCQSLISSQKIYIITNLANYPQKVSYDRINRYF